MSRIFFSIVFIFQIMNILCQNKECNKRVDWTEEDVLIPDNICIPRYHHIIQLDSSADLNLDGLKDFTCIHMKEQITDGDTVFYSIYLQNFNKSYSLKKQFSNIQPLWFKSYDLEYVIKDSILDSIQFLYSGLGRTSVNFSDGLIELHVPQGVGETYVLYYKYDKDNWYLNKEIFTFDSDKISKYDGERIYDSDTTLYTKDKQTSIDKFNLLDYRL